MGYRNMRPAEVVPVFQLEFLPVDHLCLCACAYMCDSVCILERERDEVREKEIIYIFIKCFSKTLRTNSNTCSLLRFFDKSEKLNLKPRK